MTEPANPSHALALVLVDELARCGVTEAVLAPGSRSAALAMVLHDEPRVRLHVEVDERSAGFLAIGLARATGRPAVVVVTSGSAVANLHPAVVEADTGQVPLLLVTADRPPELHHTGANQTIDQAGLFGRAPRHAVTLGVAEDRAGQPRAWRSVVSRAVAETLGLSGPPGPVHLDVPFREPTVPASDDGRAPAERPYATSIDGRADGRPYTSVTRAPRVLPDPDLTDLAARLVATERGLVVVGQSSAEAAAIVALAEATGYPLVAEPTSGARRGPLAIGTAHHLLGHEGFRRRHVPDLVLRIGRTGLSRPLASHLGAHVPQLLIDPDGTWADPERTVSELVVADVAATCRALAGRLAVPASSEWGERWRAADAAARGAIDAVLDADDRPTEPRAVRDVAAALPDGATLVVASSMPIRDLDQVLAPRPGLRVLANRGASGIDGFVSTALGVALAASDPSAVRLPGPTVALTGDLSLLHDTNGLLVSPDAATLDLTIVVLDNDGGGIFSFLPQAAYPASFERVFGTPHGRDLAALAALHDLAYHPVTSAAALAPTMTAATEAGGLHLVHVRTDRATNVEVHRRLTAAVHRALDELATSA